MTVVVLWLGHAPMTASLSSNEIEWACMRRYAKVWARMKLNNYCIISNNRRLVCVYSWAYKLFLPLKNMFFPKHTCKQKLSACRSSGAIMCIRQLHNFRNSLVLLQTMPPTLLTWSISTVRVPIWLASRACTMERVRPIVFQLIAVLRRAKCKLDSKRLNASMTRIAGDVLARHHRRSTCAKTLRRILAHLQCLLMLHYVTTVLLPTRARHLLTLIRPRNIFAEWMIL